MAKIDKIGPYLYCDTNTRSQKVGKLGNLDLAVYKTMDEACKVIQSKVNAD